MPAQELHRESLSSFNSLIDTCDVVVLCQTGFRADIPLPAEIVDIKRLVKQFYNTAVDKVSSTLFLIYSVNIIYTTI